MKGALVLVLCAAVLLPGAAAAETRSFLVFFFTGSTVITPQGETTIGQFVRVCGPSGFDAVVHGHTDTAESSDALAQARGDAVRDRMIALGFPATRISVVSHGAKSLLVPTAPNTPEPQNRRVEQVCH
ncbi:MAG TPA: OmpA family protein [Reyranella sp.]|jgi:outer membrane protein OmpA-like peptidoglycan-associated protein|nr:OmpA family protein [Reyranella sp.]